MHVYYNAIELYEFILPLKIIICIYIIFEMPVWIYASRRLLHSIEAEYVGAHVCPLLRVPVSLCIAPSVWTLWTTLTV